MKNILLSAVLGLSIIFSSAASAKPACDQSAGSIIFEDMMYGLGAGLILTGLYMAASKEGDYADQRLSAGSLVGATIGVGAGVLELGMRQCPDTQMNLQRTGMQKPKPYLDQNGGGGVSISYTFN